MPNCMEGKRSRLYTVYFVKLTSHKISSSQFSLQQVETSNLQIKKKLKFK